jgi:hypothetical protein
MSYAEIPYASEQGIFCDLTGNDQRDWSRLSRLRNGWALRLAVRSLGS